MTNIMSRTSFNCPDLEFTMMAPLPTTESHYLSMMNDLQQMVDANDALIGEMEKNGKEKKPENYISTKKRDEKVKYHTDAIRNRLNTHIVLSSGEQFCQSVFDDCKVDKIENAVVSIESNGGIDIRFHVEAGADIQERLIYTPLQLQRDSNTMHAILQESTNFLLGFTLNDATGKGQKGRKRLEDLDEHKKAILIVKKTYAKWSKANPSLFTPRAK